jgi:phage terminase large subunit-like protein
VGDFVEECAAFPNGRYDDQVDAMSQALLRLTARANPAARRRQPSLSRETWT